MRFTARGRFLLFSFYSDPIHMATDKQHTLVQSDDERTRSKAISEQVTVPGLHVPGYELQSLLGEGAYGAVWLAREQKTGKDVAIKFYTHRGGLDWALLSREVEKLALLYTSRNIVGLLDVGWQSNPPYYIMEYLEGGSLETQLAGGALPATDAVRVIQGVCQALVHAHGRGVLHCDLKPANVLIDDGYEARLCDFGQSRLSTEQNPALGTLFYMAPEQADMKALPDARWDVYALGALLHHVLVGEPPFRSPDAERRLQNADTLEERLATYRTIVTTSPRPKKHWRTNGVDRRLADVVDRCLHVDPEKRYANAQEVLDVLYLRERQRRVQPLVALGGILPGLLLFAMFVFAFTAMKGAVGTAETNITLRALESDLMSVNILANGVQRELEDRIEELEQIANDPVFLSHVESGQRSNWDQRDRLTEFLDGARADVNERRAKLGREVDQSWFFVDVIGIQRWREPFDESVINQSFSHRDYFHGLGKEFKVGQVPPDTSPIKKPHISLSFVSNATNKSMVAIAVPVRRGDEIVGVLARTTHLGQLLSSFEFSTRGQDGVNRTVALVDQRDWRLLDHSRLIDPRFAKSITESQLLDLRLSDVDIEKIKRAKNTRKQTLPAYRDPMAKLDPDNYGGEWLAAFAPVELPQIGSLWTAIVQEPKTQVLLPVFELEADLRRYAWFAFGFSGIVVAMLWYFVLKSISERGMRHWLRSSGGQDSQVSDSN
jgi:eukaryotic-like serine/threonine-protein kinase